MKFPCSAEFAIQPIWARPGKSGSFLNSDLLLNIKLKQEGMA
jgi:hypothetical protein